MRTRDKLPVSWFALGLSLLILGMGGWTLSPLIDAETLKAPVSETLHLPVFYTILAPWCHTLDSLTLLSLRQHLALLGVAFAVFLVWRVVRCWRYRRLRFFVELGGILGFLVVVLTIYALGVLVPRPVARLVLHDPQAVSVDFHSHTDASWDGRAGFDAHANRVWHQGKGFDVAYITDHAGIAGARVGLAHNPARAGDGTVLLLGLEARDADEHILALDIDTTRDVDPRGQWHDPHLSPVLARDIRAPLLILSLPGNIRSVPYTERRGNAPLYAVELSDGSPKGIDQVHRDRDQILQLADSLNLALVSGSDNHGWGETAVAWSILHIPGWQAMSPHELDSAIYSTVRRERRHAVQVIERRSPDPDGSFLQLLATPISMIVVMLRTFSWGERIAWIAWIWVIWGIGAMIRRRRSGTTTRPVIPMHTMRQADQPDARRALASLLAGDLLQCASNTPGSLSRPSLL